MMQETGVKLEQVSALVDGQLQGGEFACAVDWIAQEADARLTWHAYHVVGEVLRIGQALDSTRDADFLVRLRQELKQDAAQGDDATAIDFKAAGAIPALAKDQFNTKIESANDSQFRWKFLAGFASLAAVLVIGWKLVGSWDVLGGQSQLAQVTVQPGAPAVIVVQDAKGESQVMIGDPQLGALLTAHRQFGGTSALQKPAGFLRNATFVDAGR